MISLHGTCFSKVLGSPKHTPEWQRKQNEEVVVGEWVFVFILQQEDCRFDFLCSLWGDFPCLLACCRYQGKWLWLCGLGAFSLSPPLSLLFDVVLSVAAFVIRDRSVKKKKKPTCAYKALCNKCILSCLFKLSPLQFLDAPRALFNRHVSSFHTLGCLSGMIRCRINFVFQSNLIFI